ncbi:hypothetical protein SUGI_0737140 [Cryptomeria japonica]|uniref:adenylyltransferase and sulfurtransferase MOCS3 n=1 Tax=Cryptomeria japonica TaxID=3369 RepID=UPI002414B90C|nr:adenylyltransferase and sulfurtransferase MOCS3 [Cryptomeria japonica]GLJ36641.1 hypothetical protein SUGI_0737140 [Cryptomeria japonica]
MSGVRNVEREVVLEEIEKLKKHQTDIQHRINLLQTQLEHETPALSVEPDFNNNCGWKTVSGHGLSAEMIQRFSRHLLLPAFGVEGQSKILKSSVLLVGAGGLGSPAALYLASCGIGCLGIIDYDVVEMNNLHRQVIHTEANIGKSKVKSAAAACHAINSAVKVVEYMVALSTANALDIVGKYDIVVDATDNVATRYLINDSCVILGKPLVSGAALGFEGQLTVYHYNQGPCYRCLFPIPPPIDACQRCSDNGVLGVVPGIIGSLQALEAIKIASGVGDPLSGRMLIFDALPTRIYTVKLRGRSPKCTVCGDNPEISFENFQNFDYEKFTQSPMSDKGPLSLCLLPSSQRVTSREFKQHQESGKPYVLLDVRENHQYKIASLPDSLNISLSHLETKVQIIHEAMKEMSVKRSSQESMSFEEANGTTLEQISSRIPLYVVCRRGNDSQRAVQYLCSQGFHAVHDIIGGLEAWTKEVDRNFPSY